MTGQDFAVQSGWKNHSTAVGDPSLTLFLGGAGGNTLLGRLHAAIILARALGTGEHARLALRTGAAG